MRGGGRAGVEASPITGSAKTTRAHARANSAAVRTWMCAMRRRAVRRRLLQRVRALAVGVEVVHQVHGWGARGGRENVCRRARADPNRRDTAKLDTRNARNTTLRGRYATCSCNRSCPLSVRQAFRRFSERQRCKKKKKKKKKKERERERESGWLAERGPRTSLTPLPRAASGKLDYMYAKGV